MAISVKELNERINRLQQELDELKSDVKRKLGNGGRTVADLYGVLAGQLDMSEDDIEAVEYKLDWDKLLPEN